MNKISDELETIRKENAGILKPSDVVSYASDPDTELHGCFDWDDTSAGGKYRLWQARQLIRVSIEILPQTEKETHVYVSLSSDRYSESGYRHIVEVLSDEDMRAELLGQAKAELKDFRRKYRELQELANIFTAIDTVCV